MLAKLRIVGVGTMEFQEFEILIVVYIAEDVF